MNTTRTVCTDASKCKNLKQLINSAELDFSPDYAALVRRAYALGKASVRNKLLTSFSDNKTRRDVNRMLLLSLGDPKAIIADNGLSERHINHFRTHLSTLTLVIMLANSHGGEWAEVVKFLKLRR
jgi:hypothetical protein